MCCIQLEISWVCYQNFQLHLRERRFNEVFSVPSVVTLVVVVLRSCGETLVVGFSFKRTNPTDLLGSAPSEVNIW